MLINIIHAPNRHDRKVLLDSEVKEHNLKIKLWPAIIDPVCTFRGINLAHKQIIRDAKEKKLPMVCCGEDDLHLTGKGAFEYFIAHIPKDFDMYFAGLYCEIGRVGNIVKDLCGLHLYIVHERFYDCFLSIDELSHLDRGLANRGKYIVSNPYCAVQHDGWSDQKQKYASYGHLLTGKAMCCEGYE